MQRRGQQRLSQEEQQQQSELNQLNAITNRMRKLKRKFEAELDPVQDRLDAINELQVFVQNYITGIVNERDTLKAEIRAEREQNKVLNEELKEFKKQLEPNIEAKPEPEKKKEPETEKVVPPKPAPPKVEKKPS